MTALIVRRLLVSIPVAFIVLSLTFLLCRLAPGNPFANGKSIRPEIMAQLNKQHDLDGTLWDQYWRYMGKVVCGDLNISTQYLNRSVDEIIAQTLPISITLGSLAYALALFFGVVLGAWAAVRHNEWGDRSLMLVALLGISIPTFVSAPLLVMFFALYPLHILPAYGWGSPDQILLPAFCLSLPFTASIARLTRGSLLEVLKLDFIRTARAKGLPEALVMYRHALKPAMIGVVTIIGVVFGYLMGGAVVVENVFSWNGLGRLAIQAINYRDYPLIQGFILLFATIIVIMSVLLDIAYAWLDPRISVS